MGSDLVGRRPAFLPPDAAHHQRLRRRRHPGPLLGRRLPPPLHLVARRRAGVVAGRLVLHGRRARRAGLAPLRRGPRTRHLCRVLVRCFHFYLFESPKFLFAYGRQDEAVAVVHGIARRNGTKSWLTSAILDCVASDDDTTTTEMLTETPPETPIPKPMSPTPPTPPTPGPGARPCLAPPSCAPEARGPLRRATPPPVSYADARPGDGPRLVLLGRHRHGLPALQRLSAPVLCPSCRRPGTAVGHGPSDTAPISREAYRDYAVTSLVGVPGSLLAARLVDHPLPLLGRPRLPRSPGGPAGSRLGGQHARRRGHDARLHVGHAHPVCPCRHVSDPDRDERGVEALKGG